MSFESINRLSELTGRDRRTVKKSLVLLVPVIKGRSHLYDSREALLLIYGSATSGDFDLTEQRARLAFHQANNERLKEEERTGQLIPADAVEQAWLDHVTAARAVLLALPTKLAPIVMSASTIREVEDFARDEIFRALDSLADETAPD